ncbi:MAG: cytochrome C [Rhodobacteraceae bacterium]|jgi:cytochrome c|nr:cytochrome C [Paracoccaceae bacterium]
MKTRLALVAAGLLAAAPALAGDPEAGAREWAKCRACHAIVAADGTVIQRGAATGPNLYNVIGRAAGSVEGFRYSAGMTEAGEKGLVWDEASIVAYTADPTAFLREYTGNNRARGNMAFKLARGVDDIVAYLDSVVMEADRR